jgi:tetratricopeptide (TPR) repeat protein
MKRTIDLRLHCNRLWKSKGKRQRQRRYGFFVVALIFLLFQIFGNKQTMAQPISGAMINGADPRYNSSPAAVNHLILGIDQIANNELWGARQNFLFIIKLKDDAPAMGGMLLKPRAYLNLGVVDTLEDNPEAAIKNFLAAIELDPMYSEAYFNLGTVYYKGKNLKDAERAFLKAIEIQPEYGRAHYSLGFLYFDQKKYDLAKLHAEKAAEYGVPFKTLKERLAKVGR